MSHATDNGQPLHVAGHHPAEFRPLQLSPEMRAVAARCTTPRQIAAGNSRASRAEEVARIKDRIDNWRRKP